MRELTFRHPLHTQASPAVSEEKADKGAETKLSYQTDFDYNSFGNSALCLDCASSNETPSGVNDEKEALDDLSIYSYIWQGNCIKPF